MALSNARFLFADARGSIALRTDSTGGSATVNTYDDWGVTGSANSGRWLGLGKVPRTSRRLRFTGQIWLPELAMYYYKARVYSPRLGRFLQTDPIGYEDQVNLYAYVANDPINAVDPTGMCGEGVQRDGCSIQYNQTTGVADPETRNSVSMLDAIPASGEGPAKVFDPKAWGIGTEASHGNQVANAVQGLTEGSSLGPAAQEAARTGEAVAVSFKTIANPTNAIGNYTVSWSGTLKVADGQYQISATGTVAVQEMNWERGTLGTNPIRDVATVIMGKVGPQGSYDAVPNRTISGNFKGSTTPAPRGCWECIIYP